MKLNDGSRIIHCIYFILNERTDENFNKCIEACRKYLSKHKGISKFSIGKRAEDLRREVNDCAFDIAMTIIFENKEAYDDYLNDPDHEEWFVVTKSYVAQTSTRVFDSYLAYGNPPKVISKDLVEQLSSKIEGYVLEPGDSRFVESTQIDNGRIQLKPGLIVLANNSKDVKETLDFVKKNNLPFNIKGGGHSAAGYCLNKDGVVLDMMHLNDMSFDKKNETIKVGMGVRWKSVYEFMEKTNTGLIPVGGGCPTVGPAGFVLGGGYSFVSRSYGLCVDNLLSLNIITPDGKLRKVGHDSSTKEDKDIFWACRGGGGGNFGIVTEMEMRVRKPHSEKMLVGQITFPMEQAVEVIDFYNKWVETLPDSMAVYGRWGQQPDAVDASKKIKTLSLTPVYNGHFKDGIELLQGILKMGPINSNIRNMTLPQWEFYNGYSTLVANRSAYIKSLMIKPTKMDAKVAKVFVEFMTKAPSDESFVVWTHGGGQISKKTNAETAFYHREARFIPELKAIWDLNKPNDRQKNIEWSNDFFDELTRTSEAPGAYVNYIDPLLHNWQNKYYGENYARLESIKNNIDPDNYFNFQQSIGSNFNPPQIIKDLSPLDRTKI